MFAAKQISTIFNGMQWDVCCFNKFVIILNWQTESTAYSSSNANLFYTYNLSTQTKGLSSCPILIDTVFVILRKDTYLLQML